MRKLIPILAVLCLALIPMAAYAGSCGSKSASNAGSSCDSHALKSAGSTAAQNAGSSCGSTAAQNAGSSCGGNAAKNAGSSCGSNAVKTAGSSCGSNAVKSADGSCSAHALKTAGSGACASGAGSACCATTADCGDFNVTSYFTMKSASASGCTKSMRNAASEWRKQLTQNMKSAESDELRDSMGKLARMLKSFPYAGRSQQVRFEKITEWCAAYCEQFPARATGTKIVADPETGQRIVELTSFSG